MEKFLQDNLKSEKIKSNENEIEKSQIKEGVDFVFEQNPELANIGTKEQYVKYLETIFPESKIRDIVYHGTQNNFDQFDENKISENSGNFGFYGKGFYFTPDQRSIHGDVIVKALINIRNPYHFDMKGDLSDSNNLEKYFAKKIDETFCQNKKGYEDYYNELYDNYDGVVVHRNMGKSNDSISEISIFNVSNIHILGSKADIENFKKFVTN